MQTKCSRMSARPANPRESACGLSAQRQQLAQQVLKMMKLLVQLSVLVGDQEVDWVADRRGSDSIV
eukprot:2279990-Prorocentrum_lima.AAC.1